MGVVSSTVTTVLVYERIRDRSLLCEKKFDDSEIRSYTYKMVPLYFIIISNLFPVCMCDSINIHGETFLKMKGHENLIILM